MWNLEFLAMAIAVVLAFAPSHASTMPSNLTTEPAQFFPQLNSQRVKIRYGPFTVGSMDINNGMADFEQKSVQMPCTDCLITWMQAGLEYANGTVANADTNLWLHHTVFANLNRTSTICPGTSPDVFFASGNERTPINICVNGSDQVGYYLGPTDTVAMEAELMNMSPTSQESYVTLTYEYIPTPPSSFSQVKVLWLDIGGCFGNSDQPVKSATQPFNYTSPEWVSNISGRITFIAGHLHDGGMNLDIRRNGTEVCQCVATYGANSAYIGGGMPMSMTMGSSSMPMSKRAPATSTLTAMTTLIPTSSSQSSLMDTYSASMAMPSNSGSSGLMDNIHISNMSTCANPNNGLVNPGDAWTVTAYYDPSQRDLMTSVNGTPAPIMGIAMVYVANLNSTIASGSTISSSSVIATGISGAGRSAELNMRSSKILMSFGLGWTIMTRMLL